MSMRFTVDNHSIHGIQLDYRDQHCGPAFHMLLNLKINRIIVN